MEESTGRGCAEDNVEERYDYDLKLFRGIEAGIQNTENIIECKTRRFFNELHPSACVINGLDLLNHDVT